MGEQRAVRGDLGPEGPGRGKTVVLGGVFVRGGKFPPSPGLLSCRQKSGQTLGSLPRGFISHGLWHQEWLPGLVLDPAPHPHSARLFPHASRQLQGTYRPKGKQCQTIGHPGRPSGTRLCVPDKGTDVNTARRGLSILLCLPCPHPQAPCSLVKGEV